MLQARATAISRKKRRTQEERSATARANLIAAAIQLICENGFARTTTADIARVAGLTRGAIQHHFEGRVDLVTTILLDVEKRVLDSFTAAAPRLGLPLEQRIDILIDGLGAVTRSPTYLAAMDIWFTSRSDPDLREVVVQSMRRYVDHFRELWRTTFCDEVPEAAISDSRRVVVAVSRGLIFSRLISPDRMDRSITLTLKTTKDLIKGHMLAARDRKKGR
ncbi:MAG TPA: TetR family transcriptional regulator [Nevskiaceae bacterium]|nr:TetR family transcriptional regulator [Nevskiaceae bacterium]